MNLLIATDKASSNYHFDDNNRHPVDSNSIHSSISKYRIITYVIYSINFDKYIEQEQMQYIAVTINNATELLAQPAAMNICQQT